MNRKKKDLITRAEMEEALTHIEKSNSELGNVDARLSRIEGQLGEALPDIKKSVEAIFSKFDKLPCGNENARLVKVETRLKDILKTRYILLTTGVSGFVAIVVYLMTHQGS